MPEVDRAELDRALGARRGARAAEQVARAADAFAAERYQEARRELLPVAEQAPGVAVVRELLGITSYRLGRFAEAARELERFVELTGGSTEQHPVLADCYRALRRWDRVDELWAELRAASPSSELVTEGRVVFAGALADRGRLDEAIATLARGWRFPARPRPHHLRRAYALADLYDRAGELPAARELFGRVAQTDPGFADAAERAVG